MASLRVLVIDDDEDVRALLETMIRVSDGFELAGATRSAMAGIAMASTHRPDAVVLDLGMPGLDGLRALPMLRQAFDGVVIVFSAFPDPYTLLAAVEAGADGYLDKARAWSELLPAVARACESVTVTKAGR